MIKLVNKEKDLWRYIRLTVLIGVFVLFLHFFINNISFENRKPKTFILDKDLFRDGVYDGLSGGFQVENVTRLSLPWSIWDLQDLDFINTQSLIFTLDRSLEGGDRLNTINHLRLYNNENYDSTELAHNITNSVFLQDEMTLLFSPINSNCTHVYRLDRKMITETLDGIVYKLLPNKKKYILNSNDVLYLRDMDDDEKKELISIEDLEDRLNKDYKRILEREAKHLLDRRYAEMGLTIETGEYEGKSYDHVLEKSLIEYYQAGGEGWRADQSRNKGLYYLPFIYLNPWDFQASADESKIYFKVNFGLYTSIYALDTETYQIKSVLEGNILDFKPLDNDKLIILDNEDEDRRLYIYDIQDEEIEELISRDVLNFDVTPDGKLVYIRIDSSGIYELRAGHYLGDGLKAHNTVYLSSEYIAFLKWSLSGGEFYCVNDSIGRAELLRFKIRTN